MNRTMHNGHGAVRSGANGRHRIHLKSSPKKRRPLLKQRIRGELGTMVRSLGRPAPKRVGRFFRDNLIPILAVTSLGAAAYMVMTSKRSWL